MERIINIIKSKFLNLKNVFTNSLSMKDQEILDDFMWAVDTSDLSLNTKRELVKIFKS